jgi:hypothetical protein
LELRQNIDASLVVVSGGCELLGPNENRDEDFLVSFDDGVKVKSELDATILLDVSSFIIEFRLKKPVILTS